MDSKKEDRLSSLANDILIIILSFLHTKTAATTAVLSRSWRNLWINITTLRLTSIDYPKRKLYLNRVSSQHIQTIELDMEGESNKKMSIEDFGTFGTRQHVKEFKLIFRKVRNRFVIPRFVEVFELHLHNMDDDVGTRLQFKNPEIKFVYPNLRKIVMSLHDVDHLFCKDLFKFSPLLETLRLQVEFIGRYNYRIEINAQNLKCLNISLVTKRQSVDERSGFMVDAPKLECMEVFKEQVFRLDDNLIGNCKLPNLRKLVINLREFDLSSFGILVRSCLLLELLRVHVDVLEKFHNSIEIKSRSLKSLIINLVSEKHSLDEENAIEVDAPQLKHLEVISSCMVKCCFPSTSGDLLKAIVSMGDGKPRTPERLSPMQGLSIVNPLFRVRSRTLSLSGDIVLALSNLNHTTITFDKLSHLEVSLCNSRSWIGVKRFLRFCPNLQKLVLRRKCAEWNDRGRSEIDILPRWLHNKIRSIELWNLDGSKCELKLIDYIFNVAKELKHLYINTDGSLQRKMLKREIQFRQKLFNLSNNLPNCEIRFRECCIQEGKELKSTNY